MSRERAGKRIASSEAIQGQLDQARAELRDLVESGAVDSERLSGYLADLEAEDLAEAPPDLVKALREGLPPGTTARVTGEWLLVQLPGRRVLARIVADDIGTGNAAGGAGGRPGGRSRRHGQATRSGQARQGGR